MNPDDPKAELDRLLETTRDSGRPEAVASRHARGYRTARENLEDLCDPGSFVEYGQLAVAAQRRRRSEEELRRFFQERGAEISDFSVQPQTV